MCSPFVFLVQACKTCCSSLRVVMTCGNDYDSEKLQLNSIYFSIKLYISFSRQDLPNSGAEVAFTFDRKSTIIQDEIKQQESGDFIR